MAAKGEGPSYANDGEGLAIKKDSSTLESNNLLVSQSSDFVHEQIPIQEDKFDNSMKTQAHSTKQKGVDLNALPADPGERLKIDSYHPNDRDEVRRAYLQKGPCQPRSHDFQQRDIGGRLRRFNSSWFDEYKYWQTDLAKHEYKIRLNASIDCIRFLLRQGLPFRGHDEHENSSNKVLELLHFYAERNDEVGRVVLHNAPGNQKMIASSIQKDIVHAAAKETTKAIIDDLKDDYFAILVDECRDVSCKEQMALVLRYVDKRGFVVERFIGLTHVSDTSAASLKDVVSSMLSEHKLSLSRIRGQGYDGASNMRGEFNGLKSLIMRETGSAYYVHCFAHQLQLALIFVAKNHFTINDFFDLIAPNSVIESLINGELQTGRGLNQEVSIKRPGDTCWGSHYASLLNIMTMFSSIIYVLEDVERHGAYQDQKAEARRLLELLESFDFIFCLYLMVAILGITNEVNLAWQKKDQEIINAMSLVRTAKERLQQMRDSG
ncbi:uncharacterized protein LOC126656872 [Mercurialis annua]|uniref:uncharacterized protein LOC126656872 n=1 Tax=Mercurialis annua TaxID=3986 RepID=UPI002160C6F0|nr:uncharacterized protein LOC126656872 [Mercurialis annua]